MSSFLEIFFEKINIYYRLIRVVLVAQAEVSSLKQVEVFVDIVQKILTRSLSLENKKHNLKIQIFHTFHKFDLVKKTIYRGKSKDRPHHILLKACLLL